MTTCSPLYCHDCAELQCSQSLTLCTRRNCSKLSNSATLICLVFVVGSFLCKKFMIFQSSFCDHKQYGSLKKLHDQQSVAGYHHRYAINIYMKFIFSHGSQRSFCGYTLFAWLVDVTPSSLPKPRDNIESTHLRQWCIFGITGGQERNISSFFLILSFSPIFPQFLPQFGPLVGRLAHPGRPWLRHWCTSRFAFILLISTTCFVCNQNGQVRNDFKIFPIQVSKSTLPSKNVVSTNIKHSTYYLFALDFRSIKSQVQRLYLQTYNVVDTAFIHTRVPIVCLLFHTYPRFKGCIYRHIV